MYMRARVTGLAISMFLRSIGEAKDFTIIGSRIVAVCKGRAAKAAGISVGATGNAPVLRPCHHA
jgi:hypothetical protein